MEHYQNKMLLFLFWWKVRVLFSNDSQAKGSFRLMARGVDGKSMGLRHLPKPEHAAIQGCTLAAAKMPPLLCSATLVNKAVPQPSCNHVQHPWLWRSGLAFSGLKQAVRRHHVASLKSDPPQIILQRGSKGCYKSD